MCYTRLVYEKDAVYTRLVYIDIVSILRNEQDGQNFLDDLERRVQARDGAYGEERMQRTMVKTRGKKVSIPIDKAICEERKKSYVKPHCRSKRKPNIKK